MTLLFFLGCPWVAETGYQDVRDVDADGGISVRFGGRDCQDDNPAIVDCDADRDGHTSARAGGDDCDDARRDVNPEAEERCDGRDNDCDGAVDNDDDDAVGGTFFADTDGDGDGDPDSTVACRIDGLHVANDDDCDDLDPAIHTGADELCDGVDNNCDGVTDDAGLWFVDADGDGFGDPSLLGAGPCVLTDSDTLTATGGDCDDSDASVNPARTEVPYDSVDDNCNGGQDNWDVDLDGHVPDLHWPSAQAQNLQLPAALRWSIAQGDCDDTDPRRFLDNPEICDGVDNDCDQLVDLEDLGDPGTEPALESQVLTLFADADADGHAGTPVLRCPADVTASDASTSSDCDDTDPARNPDAVETCDTVDNDCDGRTDWSPVAFQGSSEHFRDIDGDGFGDTPVQACAPDLIARLVTVGGDCNDSDAATHPQADEICGDTTRQDCTQASVWDCDGDGQEGAYFGNGSGEDCDDQHPGVYSTNAALFEVCDGIDNDCDGNIDTQDTDNLDLTHLPFWLSDDDGDGYGLDTDPGVQQCEAPNASATVFAGDCDDTDPELNPTTRWYADLDLDGFGVFTAASDPSCSPPAGDWSRVPGDCNDNNADFHPAVVWLPDDDGDFVGDPARAETFCLAPTGWVRASDGIDCDDANPDVTQGPTWYLDSDGDGTGNPEVSTLACAAPGTDWVLIAGDCNDADPTRHPGRQEVCNGIDDDCDGDVDDDDLSVLGTGPLGYQDVDGDGYGTSTVSKRFCTVLPAGWRAIQGDCDDTNPHVQPGAIEICGNGLDDDCTGSEETPTWYADLDGDGFGAGLAETTACDAPTPGSWSTNATDCDDAQPTIHPASSEQDACDAIDQDCDGTPEPRLAWYLDSDGDGFGDDTTEQSSCTSPSPDHVLQGGDCDDTEAAVTFGRLWFLDHDEDGLGDATRSVFACPIVIHGVEQPLWDDHGVQRSIFAGDCDDSSPAVAAERPFFIDEDGDGYGSLQQGVVSRCADADASPPDGLSIYGGDCVDREEDLNVAGSVDPAAINPLGMDDPHQPDGEDNDCDGTVDIAASGAVWFADADGDGVGVPPALPAFQPGAVPTSGDCDDSDSAVQHGRYGYTDADEDGAGTGALTFRVGCTPLNFASVPGDCDDHDDQVHPAATETCNGTDDDCNGIPDDLGDLVFPDVDNDGHTALPPVWHGCAQVQTRDHPSAVPDCDDDDALVHPLAVEICDDRDQDCDGQFDEDLATNRYPDADRDGDTLAAGVVFVCGEVAPGYTETQGHEDCDDTNAAVHHDAEEVCGDGIDNDCTGNADESGLLFLDEDHDGYGIGVAQLLPCISADRAVQGGDCDDHASDVNSGQPTDDCNGVDNDCDGVTDGDADFTTYWLDIDGDTHGDRFQPLATCDGQPDGYVSSDDDCDDLDVNVNPNATEVECTGLDENCDGVLHPDEEDEDADGFMRCEGDCDDTSALANPNQLFELCDGIDNDCDGAEVDGDPDVSNPYTGTELAGEGSPYLATLATGFSTTIVSSCNPHPEGHWIGGGPPFVLSMPSDPASAHYVCFDDHTRTATLYARDDDGDGVGGWDGNLYDGVFTDDCPGSDISGYGLVHGAFDCAPNDFQRSFVLQPGQYADEDQDGDASLLPLTQQVCGGFAHPAHGTDCDDRNFGMQSQVHAMVRSNAELALVMAHCNGGDVTLDWNSEPAFTWPATVLDGTIMRISGAGWTCDDPAATSECLADVQVTAANVDLTFENIGLTGDMSSQHPGTTLNFDRVHGYDLHLSGWDAIFIDDSYIENADPMSLGSLVTGSAQTVLEMNDSVFIGWSDTLIAPTLHFGTISDSTLWIRGGAISLDSGFLNIFSSDLRDPTFDSSLFDLTGDASVYIYDSQLQGAATMHDGAPLGVLVDAGAQFSCSGCVLFDTTLSASNNFSNIDLYESILVGDTQIQLDAGYASLTRSTIRDQTQPTILATNNSSVTVVDLTMRDSVVDETFLEVVDSFGFIEDLTLLDGTSGGNASFLRVEGTGQLDVQGLRMVGSNDRMNGVLHQVAGNSTLRDVHVMTRNDGSIIHATAGTFSLTDATVDHDIDSSGFHFTVFSRSIHPGNTITNLVATGAGGIRQEPSIPGAGSLQVVDSDFYDLNTRGSQANGGHFSGSGNLTLRGVRAFENDGPEPKARMVDAEASFHIEDSLFVSPSPQFRTFTGAHLLVEHTTIRALEPGALLDPAAGEMVFRDSLIYDFDGGAGCTVFASGPLLLENVWLRHTDQVLNVSCPGGITASNIVDQPPGMALDDDTHWASDPTVRSTFGELSGAP